MTDETYPGTDMLIRFCYSCGKTIAELGDLWVDYDSNCCVCTACRDGVRDYYASELLFSLSIVRARPEDAGMINETEEG